MAKKRRKFTREFRAEAVKLAKDTGKGVAAVAKDLGLSSSSLCLWTKQHEIDAGQGPAGALTTAEKQELTQLRRENRELRMEREFQKKVLIRLARCDKDLLVDFRAAKVSACLRQEREP